VGQAPDMPAGLQHKSATVEPIVVPNDATGEVTAIVSVTNIVDEVGDVILPGAYTATLAKRRPKGVWSHSWKDWVARTEDIREYAPGDPQLKMLLAEAGASLPADAGALVVRCRFNFDDPESKAAYSRVKFFSETGECQWSIGYSVPPGKGVRDAKGIRKIHALDLYEYSPVLFGAASQSTSLSVKSADPATWPDDAETPEVTGETDDVEVTTVVPEDTAPPAGLVPEDTVVDAPAEDEVWAEDDVLPSTVDEPVDDAVLDEVEEVARQAVGDQTPEDAPTMPADEPADQVDTPDEVKDMTPDRRFLAELESRIAAMEAKYDTSPVGTAGGRQNWVDKAGGLPPFIRAVAHALIRSGKSKAQATIAEWDAKRGSKTAEVDTETPAGEPGGLLTKWDPAAEVGRWAAHKPTVTGTQVTVEAKTIPYLAGSREEHREMVRVAVADVLAGDDGRVGIDGTWDDQVVATVHGPAGSKTYRVPYTLTTDEATGDGTVLLGTPTPTRLMLSDGDAGDELPQVLVDGVDAVLLGAKLLAAGPEVKAGRVLSGSNAERIGNAVESLIAVLQSAGVQINAPQQDQAPATDQQPDPVTDPAADPVEMKSDPVMVELLADAVHLRALALRI
jgi:hypothetical protein